MGDHRNPDTESADARRRELRRTLAAPAVFGLSIGVAFLDAHLARFFWPLLLPVMMVAR